MFKIKKYAGGAMSKQSFKKLLVDNQAEIKKSLRQIELSNKRFDENYREITNAL